GEVGQFAELWGMYEQASATTAADAGAYAYGAQSDAATRELSLAVAELQSVQRALDTANGVQTTIATQTAANVAATREVQGAVKLLADRIPKAASAGALSAIQQKAAR